MGTILRTAFAAVIAAVLATPLFSASVSFTGNFVNDNDLQLFTFNLSLPGTVTFLTLGFGGSGNLTDGKNAAGDVITPGGFESVLQIYEAFTGVAVGLPIRPGEGTCFPRMPDPNRIPAFPLCQDAYAQVPLSPGYYLLSLTQSPNEPIGNWSDGFLYTNNPDPGSNDPNFNHGFVGTLDAQGTGAWALDILSVDAAAEVPEPASGLLAAAGLILAGIGARRRRSRVS